MKLSKYFSLEEFTRSDTARRLGISNDPTPEHIQNLSDIVRAAGGIKVGVAIEVEQALLDAVKAKDVEIELADKINVPRILRKENQGGTQGGGTNPNPNDNGELG